MSNHLSNSQEQCASILSGHVKVIAGAGSGKSTMLVERIHRLIKSGIPAYSILVVMFGKDAAESFDARLKKKLSTDLSHQIPLVATFHSMSTKLLARPLMDSGKLPRAKLEASEWALRKMCISVLRDYLPDDKKVFGALFNFMSFIDLTKNHLDGPEYTMHVYDIKPENRYFCNAFERFEKKRIKEGIRFFSDLIYDPVTYLVNNPASIDMVKNKFDHILVDEYQDISNIQQMMLTILAGSRANVMVVGDDDQCIYGWRGANPSFMIDGFEKSFSGAITMQLPETFRYGHQISAGAYSLISNNRNRTPKLTTSSDTAPHTELSLDVESPGQHSVSLHIRKWIEESNSHKYTDVAVLIRAFSHSVAVEIGLLEDGIPYTLEGADPLFMAEDIGAVVACLMLITGKYSQLRIEDKTLMAIKFISYPAMGLEVSNFQNLLERIRKDPDGTPVHLDEAVYDERDSSRKRLLQERSLVWRNILNCDLKKGPADAIRYAMEVLKVVNEIKFRSKKLEEEQTKLERFEAFISYAEHSDMSLSDFVDHIQYLSGKSAAKVSTTDNRGSVIITSIHRSKGLEWPLVIIPKLVEGKFPLIKDEYVTNEQIEDERRLLFVAITRAQRKCILIAPNDRQFIHCAQKGIDQPLGPLEPGEGIASRFLYEINPFLMQRTNIILSGDSAPLKAAQSKEKLISYLKAFMALRANDKADLHTETRV